MNYIKNLFIIIVTLFFSMNIAYGQTTPKVNLVLSSPTQTYSVGDTVNIQLNAVLQQNTQGVTQKRILYTQEIFTWDTTKLQFLGIDNTGSAPAVINELAFCPVGQTMGCGDFVRLNEVVPPQDGNGWHEWLGQLGTVIYADLDGTLITTFKFKVIAPFTTTNVILVPSWTAPAYGNGVIITVVTEVSSGNTGLLIPATILGTPITGDFNGDGIVNAADMGLLLGAWGSVSYTTNPFDLDGNGVVGAGDLSIFLMNWR